MKQSLIKKIFTNSPQEITRRVYYRIKREFFINKRKKTYPDDYKYAQNRLRTTIDQFLNNLTKPEVKDFQELFFERFYISKKEEIKSFYLSNFEDEAEHTLRMAEYTINGEFEKINPIFTNCLHPDNKINWYSNLIDQQSWKVEHYTRVDFFSDKRLGDIRSIWEFNRHQFFLYLGKAYLITGNEKYSKAFIEYIDDWIDKNPVGYGINWVHSQETAIRIVSWVWSLFYFYGSPELTEKIFNKILASLYLHAEYTYLHLSYSTVTHNHIISELSGLLIFSYLFPNFPNSNKWFKISFSRLKYEIKKQFWEDGPSAEMSTNYHLFVLDSILEVYILLTKNNVKFPNEIKNRIEKAVEYVMYMIRPDGSIPLFGDNDSGRAIKFSDYNNRDRRSYLSLGAVIFNRSDFKYSASKSYEDLLWLFGVDGCNNFNNLSAVKPSNYNRFYLEGGTAFSKSDITEGSDYFAFRGGMTKFRSGVSFGHNHADQLSFEYYYKDTVFFIDPGVYTYSGGDDWRFYFRSGSSHNTVTIDDFDNVKVKEKRFGLNDYPLTKVNKYEFLNDGIMIDMSSEGFSQIGFEHRRQAVHKHNKFVLIKDSIKGSLRRNVKINFNIDKNELIKTELKNLYIIQDHKTGSKLFFKVLTDSDFDFISSKGEDSPVIGWSSYRYGTKHSATTFTFEFKNINFLTFSYILAYNENEISNFRFDENMIFNQKLNNESVK